MERLSKYKYLKHYQEVVDVVASPKEIFDYVDNHLNFSSHMNKSSMMMGGGKMKTELDADQGKVVGSHIKMSGNVLGINLFLDEVITQHIPPYRKVWETVGTPNLLVIGTYELGFEIAKENDKSEFKVFINYNLPEDGLFKLLGFLFGGIYAKWCVHQMIQSTDIFTKS